MPNRGKSGAKIGNEMKKNVLEFWFIVVMNSGLT